MRASEGISEIWEKGTEKDTNLCCGDKNEYAVKTILI